MYDRGVEAYNVYALFYETISACHLHIKDFQAFMIMPVADCLGAARPSSVLYWALSLSVGRL